MHRPSIKKSLHKIGYQIPQMAAWKLHRAPSRQLEAKFLYVSRLMSYLNFPFQYQNGLLFHLRYNGSLVLNL